MKPSQITIASAVGFLALIMIVMAGLGRVALSQSDPSTRQASPAVIVGEQVVQAFELEGFHGVAIEGAWQVNLTRGDEWQVEVSHSEDLEDELNVHISGDQLVLDVTSSGGWRWWRRTNSRLTAEIVMPELTEVEMAGASQLSLSGFEGALLVLEIAGANQLEGRDGRYDNLDLTAAGANEIDLSGVVVTDAQIDVAGASEVTLRMDGGDLEGSVAGAGGIDYYGTVAEERIKVAGISRVKRLD
jgi:hypothetical protein